MTSIAIVDDERFDAHEERTGHHPERPERLAAARSGLYAAVPEAARRMLATRLASSDELCHVHEREYVQQLDQHLSHSRFGELDADTFFSPGTREAAWLAAGSAAELATTLLRSDTRLGFALLRPPGHHAEPHTSMGFCVLNNIAVAAHAALAAGAARVAIVDFDVHHGNGTQTAFYDDPRVLFVSLHQYPFYPGTGAPTEIGHGKGLGYTANIALPRGQGPETYGYAFARVVLPLLERFKADLVLVSAGFDAHRRDPLAEMLLDADSYRALASALLDQAERLGQGRVGFLLEGGYDLRALEESVGAVARAMLGQRLALPEDAPQASGREAVELTRALLEPHWHFGREPLRP